MTVDHTLWCSSGNCHFNCCERVQYGNMLSWFSCYISCRQKGRLHCNVYRSVSCGRRLIFCFISFSLISRFVPRVSFSARTPSIVYRILKIAASGRFAAVSTGYGLWGLTGPFVRWVCLYTAELLQQATRAGRVQCTRVYFHRLINRGATWRNAREISLRIWFFFAAQITRTSESYCRSTRRRRERDELGLAAVLNGDDPATVRLNGEIYSPCKITATQ